ncbi:MAG: SGNH/GDSL hydrolase family protein, partial [Jatrophihabitantaceae bacterium]
MLRTQSWKTTAVTCSLLLAGSSVMLSGAGSSALANSPTKSASGRSDSHGGWANTWMTPVTHGDSAGSTQRGYTDTSFRSIIHTTVSGSAVRIRLSNQHGDHSITVGHATVAKPNLSTADTADIDPATLRQLSFNGQA